MSVVVRLFLVAASLLVGSQQAFASPMVVLDSCEVCTCDSGEIICVDPLAEVIEEAVLCGNACMTIGSTHGTREHVDSACDEIPACEHVSAPASGPVWLGAAALGLVAFGALRMRRSRARSAA